MMNGFFYRIISKCDIMNSYLLLLLLGYLCSGIVIDPIESSGLTDLNTSFSQISDDIYDNCTQCNAREECRCFEYYEQCIICCSDSCCICPDCNPCNNQGRNEEHQQLIMMTEITISILFAFGIFGLIIVYCKICNRTRQHMERTRRRHIVLEEARDLTRCSIIEDLRERPPSYNEIIRSTPSNDTLSRNNAPPLYTAPYNRTSMQEAPPSYPGTPKAQEKSRESNETPFSHAIVQHM